eukprot:TRINITY_DN1175_c0_g1_i1.p1 TRINITY_DN1175_c0_g1~~TRINITY_DN1175_c0_g1_i1.p1  ORF type:complete len:1406 (+),score=401.01 TRINITY_DN1175_c0_g1_i1:3-4220(+)
MSSLRGLLESLTFAKTAATIDEQVPELDDLTINQKYSTTYMATTPSLSSTDTAQATPNVAPTAQPSDASFIRKRTIPLPADADQRFGAVEGISCKRILGIEPRLSRAWCTTDNQLFIWKYDSPENPNHVAYKDLNQAIMSVAFATPKAGVFTDTVKNIIVVATTLEVHILAAIFDAKGDLEIVPTGLTTPLDGIFIRKIVSYPETGRVFLAGSDGSLLEIDYRAEETFFSKKCKKLNHTWGLSSYIPAFLNIFSSPEGITDIAIDSRQKILYTLSDKSTIRSYFLGADGTDSPHEISSVEKPWIYAERLREASQQELPPMPSEKEVNELAEKFLPGVVHHYRTAEDRWSFLVKSGSLPKKYLQRGAGSSGVSLEGKWRITDSSNNVTQEVPYLCNISTIPGESFANLVAITAFGARLFFNASNSAIRLTHLRLPEHQVRGVKSTFMNSGVFLTASPLVEKGSSEICGSTPDQTIEHPKSNSIFQFYEQFAALKIQGDVFQIAEVPVLSKVPKTLFTAPRSSPITGKQISNLIWNYRAPSARNTLALQHCTPPREFHCLSDLEISVVVEQRPIDQLKNIFERYNGVDNNGEVKRFFEKYGAIQSCAMCLALASTGISSLATTKNPMGRQSASVATWAAREFFRSGGLSIVPTTDFMQNPRCGSLALYVSRLLRPIWNVPIFKSSGFRRKKMVVELALTQEEIQEPLALFNGLRLFLDSQFRSESRGRLEAQVSIQGSQANAFNEQQIVYGLQVLVQNVSECLSFLSFLSERDFASASARLAQDQAENCVRCIFGELVASREGRDVATMAISAVVEDKTSQGRPLDDMIQQLTTQCPTIFPISDTQRYKGMELLAQAKSMSAFEARPILVEACKIFCMTNGIPNSELQKIVGLFQEKFFATGIVELCLSQAALRSEEALNDAEKEEILTILYDAIIKTLQWLSLPTTVEEVKQMGISPADIAESRESVLSLCLASKDNFLHLMLYRWMSVNSPEELCKLETPFILEFLQECPDLLWRYHSNHHRFEQAARVLDSLASEQVEIPLDKRFEYLVRAKSYLDKGMSSDVDDTFRSEINDKLDVLRIQVRVQASVVSLANAGNMDASKSSTILGKNLLNLTDLYEICERFTLSDLCLSILHCANSNEPGIPLSHWDKLLENHAGMDFRALSPVISALVQEIHPDPINCPVSVLLEKLETLGYERNSSDFAWTSRALISGGVGRDLIFQSYQDIFNKEQDNPEFLNHLYSSLAQFLQDFANSEEKSSPLSMGYSTRWSGKPLHNFLAVIKERLERESPSLEHLRAFSEIEGKLSNALGSSSSSTPASELSRSRVPPQTQPSLQTTLRRTQLSTSTYDTVNMSLPAMTPGKRNDTSSIFTSHTPTGSLSLLAQQQSTPTRPQSTLKTYMGTNF